MFVDTNLLDLVNEEILQDHENAETLAVDAIVNVTEDDTKLEMKMTSKYSIFNHIHLNILYLYIFLYRWSEGRGYSGSRRLSPCTRSSSREMRRERAWPGEDRRRPDGKYKVYVYFCTFNSIKYIKCIFRTRIQYCG